METCSSLETVMTENTFLYLHSNKKKEILLSFSTQTHNTFGFFSFTQNLLVEMVSFWYPAASRGILP